MRFSPSRNSLSARKAFSRSSRPMAERKGRRYCALWKEASRASGSSVLLARFTVVGVLSLLLPIRCSNWTPTFPKETLLRLALYLR